MEKILIKPTKRFGHLWIYRNEILSKIDHLDAGSMVKVFEERKEKFIGIGYINPKSTITVRVLTFLEEAIDRNFLKKRISESIRYREDFLGLKNTYRAVFSESDFLPGLIVDRYDNSVVIQITTAGMECLKEKILDVVDELINPENIILRNDTSSRIKEGLKLEKKVVKGDLSGLPTIIEDDVKFQIDPLHGQKTGFFLDQRENRLSLKSFINSGEGLDLFCYLGAWSIHLAKRGATVRGIDSSERAIEIAKENAKLNGVEDRVKFIKADAFDFLKWEAKRGKKYDFIILDPPAFVKSKGEKRDAIEGYINLNKAALKLLKINGILATSSCSQLISETEFEGIIKEAFKASNKMGIVLHKGTQSKDHPILLTMPETAYLKCLILKVF